RSISCRIRSPRSLSVHPNRSTIRVGRPGGLLAPRERPESTAASTPATRVKTPVEKAPPLTLPPVRQARDEVLWGLTEQPSDLMKRPLSRHWKAEEITPIRKLPRARCFHLGTLGGPARGRYRR